MAQFWSFDGEKDGNLLAKLLDATDEKVTQFYALVYISIAPISLGRATGAKSKR